MKNKFRNKAIVIKASISAGFFYILFSFTQRADLFTVFSRVDWLFFILSFLVAIIMLLVSCMKWKLLLAASGHHLHFFILLRTYLVGYFFSNILPSTVGGDLVRSYYIGKRINNQAASAAAIFLERFSGMLFLLLLVIIAPLMKWELYHNPFVYIPAIAASCFLLLLLWIWLAKEPFALPDKIITLLVKTIPQTPIVSNNSRVVKLCSWIQMFYTGLVKRLNTFKEELQTSLVTIKNDRLLFFQIFSLTGIFYLLTWVNVYVSFLAFGVETDFIAISALVPAIMLVSQVPMTLLGNLGFIESIFVIYFTQLNIPVAESLAMGLLLRIKLLSLGIIGFFIYIALSGNQAFTRPSQSPNIKTNS